MTQALEPSTVGCLVVVETENALVVVARLADVASTDDTGPVVVIVLVVATVSSCHNEK